MKSQRVPLLLLAVVAVAIVSVSGEYRFASEKLQRVNAAALHGKHELHVRSVATPLDHFNPRSDETVPLNYVQNTDYYAEGGPIYIYVNDAGQFTTEFLQIGLMHDIAHDTHAALITADNRYFRTNLPTQNASTVNLQYLTVEQSISDVAQLIRAVKADLAGAQDSKVILWGTGLGASLATWTKQKFPHLVHAVWSSSGAYQHVVHSAAIYEQLSENIARVGGAECAGNLFEAFVQISTLMERRQSARLSNAFNTCFDIAYYNQFDVAAFFAGITQILVDYINVNHATGIENFCADLAQQDAAQDSAQFEAYARWVSHVFTDEFCLDVSIFSRVEEAQDPDWEFIRRLAWTEAGLNLAYPVPSRPNLFWRCTQLGMFGTTVNADTLFGHTIGQDLYFRFCEAAFGLDYDYQHLAGAVENLNVQFGGNRPAVHDVLYTNGELDPQRGSDVHDVTGLRSYVFKIPGHGKSADLFSIGSSDHPELLRAKRYIVDLVTEWSA